MGAEGEGLSIPREDKRNKCRNLSTEMYGCSENNEANQKKELLFRNNKCKNRMEYLLKDLVGVDSSGFCLKKLTLSGKLH